jgi:hypothetical protein
MGENLNFALPTAMSELTPAYLTEALRRGGHLSNGEVASSVNWPGWSSGTWVMAADCRM